MKIVKASNWKDLLRARIISGSKLVRQSLRNENNNCFETKRDYMNSLKPLFSIWQHLISPYHLSNHIRNLEQLDWSTRSIVQSKDAIKLKQANCRGYRTIYVYQSVSTFNYLLRSHFQLNKAWFTKSIRQVNSRLSYLLQAFNIRSTTKGQCAH